VQGVDISEIAPNHDQLLPKASQTLSRLLDRLRVPVDAEKPPALEALENLFGMSANTEGRIDVDPVRLNPKEFQDLTGHDRSMNHMGFWLLDLALAIGDLL
jgi:hypothetical protein